MKIVSMDLGKSKSAVCVLDTGTGEQWASGLATRPSEVRALLGKERPDRVVIEIGPVAGWVCDLCRVEGVEVQVANPNHEAWRWKNVKHKSDRSDALKLARLSASNDLTTVHVPRPGVRAWRELINYRHTLVGESTRVKNSIRAILTRHAEPWPPGARGWTDRAVKELEKMAAAPEEPGQVWRAMLGWEIKRLRGVDKHIVEVELRLELIASADPRVALLRTIPGLGPRLAEVIVAIIDDPKRFASGKQVGCYAGLTPRRYQSGSMDRQGKISGQGPTLLRSLLVEVSWLGRRHNRWMKSVYDKALRGSPSRKKIAIVALARRLLVVCWAMLRDNTPWREEQGLDRGRMGPGAAAKSEPPRAAA